MQDSGRKYEGDESVGACGIVTLWSSTRVPGCKLSAVTIAPFNVLQVAALQP
jgi:hypothetical protein